MTVHHRARALWAAALLLAGGLPATALAASVTKPSPTQLAHMQLCLDQQGGKAGPDACRPFVAGGRAGVRTVLSARQRDRLAECIDETEGQGTVGPGTTAVADICAEFMHPAGRGR